MNKHEKSESSIKKLIDQLIFMSTFKIERRYGTVLLCSFIFDNKIIIAIYELSMDTFIFISSPIPDYLKEGVKYLSNLDDGEEDIWIKCL